MALYYSIVAFSIFMAAVSQMLLKKAATIQYGSIIREYLNPWVISGYVLLGLSLLFNIYAMSKGVLAKEVSVMESLSYVFVPALSWMCFKEVITWRKVLAIFVIIIGIVIFFY